MSEPAARPTNPNGFTNRSNDELRKVIAERAPAVIEEIVPKPDMSIREFVPEFVAELDAQGDASSRRAGNAARDLANNPELMRELEAFIGPDRRVGFVGFGDHAVVLSVEDENGKRRVLRITNADEGALRTEDVILKPLEERRIGSLKVQINEPVVDLQTLASREFDIISMSEAKQLRAELDVDVARTGIVVADSHNGNYAFKEDGKFTVADHGAVSTIDEHRAALKALPEGADRDNKLRQLEGIVERAKAAAPEIAPERTVAAVPERTPAPARPQQQHQEKPQQVAQQQQQRGPVQAEATVAERPITSRGNTPALTPQERLAAWDIADQIHTQDKFSWRETPDKKIQYTLSGDNLHDVQKSLKAAGIESEIKGRGLAISPESNDRFHALRMAGEMTDVAEGPRPMEYSAEPPRVAEQPVARAPESSAPRTPEASARGGVADNDWGLKRGAAPSAEEAIIVRRSTPAPAVDNNWGLQRGTLAPDMDMPTVLPEKISPVIERPHLGRPSVGKVVGVGGTVAGFAALAGTVAYESTGNKDIDQKTSEMPGYISRGILKGLVTETGLSDIDQATRETTLAGKAKSLGNAGLAALSVPTGIALKDAARQADIREAAGKVPAERVADIQKAVAEGAKSKDVDPQRVSDPQLRYLFQLQAMREAYQKAGVAPEDMKVRVIDGVTGTRLHGDGTPGGAILNGVQNYGGIIGAGARYVDTVRSGNYQLAMGVQPLVDGQVKDIDLNAAIEQATREYVARGGDEKAIRVATDLDFRAQDRFEKLYNTVPDGRTDINPRAVEARNGNVELIEFRALVQSGAINTPEGRARGIELSNAYFKAWDYDDTTALQVARKSYTGMDFNIANPTELVAAGMGPVFGITGKPEDYSKDLDKISKVLYTDRGAGVTIHSRINPGADQTASAADIYAALPPEMQQVASAESARLQTAALAAAAQAPAQANPVVAAAAPVEEKPAPEADIVVTGERYRGAPASQQLGDKQVAMIDDNGLRAFIDKNGDGVLQLGELRARLLDAGVELADNGKVTAGQLAKALPQLQVAAREEGAALS